MLLLPLNLDLHSTVVLLKEPTKYVSAILITNLHSTVVLLKVEDDDELEEFE